MLDLNLFADRSESELKSISDALKVLTELGVWTAQLEQNKAVLLERFEQGDANELAQEILEVRQTNQFLLALHELGQQI